MSYEYVYTYDPVATGAAVGLGIGVILFSLFFSLAMYAVMSIFLGMLFKKAGVAFWKAWVPIYNMVKFFQLGGQNPLYLLFLLLPFVGEIVVVIFACMAAFNIGKKLGKPGAGWVVLYFFVNIVWYGINGLDKSVWNEALGARSLAPETANLAQAQAAAQSNYPPQSPVQAPPVV